MCLPLRPCIHKTQYANKMQYYINTVQELYCTYSSYYFQVIQSKIFIQTHITHQNFKAYSNTLLFFQQYHCICIIFVV